MQSVRPDSFRFFLISEFFKTFPLLLHRTVHLISHCHIYSYIPVLGSGRKLVMVMAVELVVIAPALGLLSRAATATSGNCASDV